ncbi:MAG: putative nucleic acid-binding protein [Candidatus Promineifilaceae bacterium]
MKSTVVLDANVILRYLLADHPAQFLKAKATLDAVQDGSTLAFVGEGVLVECVYVLLKVYDVTRAEVADKLLGLMSYRGIKAHAPQVLMDALRLFREHNIDIVDAIIVATARRNDWKAESFDSDVRKLLK